MEKKFEITQSRVVFEYDPSPAIRKRVFEFEEQLQKYFKVPFRTYAVPETFDFAVPRFESESIHGHSKIQVSPTVLNFTTIYDEKFKHNQEEIKKYLTERAEVFSKTLSGEGKQYVAFILDLAFEMDKDLINDFIKKHAGILAITKDTVDFSITHSRAFREKFYININCSKYISEKVIIDGDNVKKTGEFIHGILVTLDLNSKYFYKMFSKHDDKLIQETANSLFEIIKVNTLENYLNGGIK